MKPIENNHKPYLQTYRKIRENAYRVNLYWEIFKRIYAGNKTRFAIINTSALKYFDYSLDVYLAYVESGLMRLLDPPITSGKHNMSVEKLIVEIEEVENNEKLSLKLRRMHARLKGKTEKLKERRNKARSHNDYNTACGHIQVPSISRKDIKDALDELKKLMAVAESLLEIKGLDECAFIEASNSVNELFNCLNDGLKFRKLLKKGFRI